jgi:hypothetical protein
MMGRTELVERAEEYCRRKGLALAQQLGFGVHGIVFSVRSQSETGRRAIKAHERQADYHRERDAYLRLEEHGIQTIRDCAVPRLLGFDDNLWIIEMTVVTRPYVLDFAGAYLEYAPEFSDEVLADWRAEKQEQFGSHWPEAERIVRILESYGIYLIDISPANIALDPS